MLCHKSPASRQPKPPNACAATEPMNCRTPGGEGCRASCATCCREPMFALLLGAGLIYLLLGDHARSLVAARLRVAVGRHRRRAGGAQRARAGSAARPDQPARPGRSATARTSASRDARWCAATSFCCPKATASRPTPVLIEARELQTDESLLTGESVPVRKTRRSRSNGVRHAPGGDDLPFVFSGTLVVRGQGLAEVRATGPRSEIGRIGQALVEIETAPADLSRQTARLVRCRGRRRAGLLRAGRRALRPAARLLAGRGARRHRPGHVDAAGGVSPGADRVHGHGRLAHVAGAGADPPCRGDRNPGRSNRAVHRQDRHADREPHDGRRAAGRRCDGSGCRCRPVGPPFRHLAQVAALASAADAYDPMDQAFHDAGTRRRTGGREAGRWSGCTACSPICWR